jgi:hypothetical protein
VRDEGGRSRNHNGPRDAERTSNPHGGRKIASSEVVVGVTEDTEWRRIRFSFKIPNRAVVAQRLAKRWARMCPGSVGCLFVNAQVLTCNEVKALTVPTTTTGKGRSRMLADRHEVYYSRIVCRELLESILTIESPPPAP